MDKETFVDFMNKYNSKYNINISAESINQLYIYMKNLLEWNKVMNLTAITDEEDVIVKHFIDSLYVRRFIEGTKGIDIGSGAGFPGIPLKVSDKELEMILVDSVNKKVNFMNDSISKLDLKNIEAIHARAEELGQDNKYREKFDFAISRAVANMSTLVEYLLPLVKVGGKVYCLKGPNVEEELNVAKNAIRILGGKVEEVKTFSIENNERCLVIISKIKNTEHLYPRKMGKPLKEPLR